MSDGGHLPALLAMVLLMAVKLSCVAHLPREGPRAVLDLERALDVVLISDPPGALVYAIGEEPGAPARLLGATPVIIGELGVRKQIWKHGDEPPPPLPPEVPAASSVDGREPEATGGNPSLRWSVLVSRDGGAPRRYDLVVEEPALPAAFRVGRLEIRLPDEDGNAGGE